MSLEHFNEEILSPHLVRIFIRLAKFLFMIGKIDLKRDSFFKDSTVYIHIYAISKPNAYTAAQRRTAMCAPSWLSTKHVCMQCALFLSTCQM